MFTRSILVITGFLFGLFARRSGEILKSTHQGVLLEKHSFFATVSLLLYGLIAAVYVVWLIRQTKWNSTLLNTPGVKVVWNTAGTISNILWFSAIRIGFVGTAFIFLSIAGALGGALAHGPDADPFVRFIYNLLVR